MFNYLQCRRPLLLFHKKQNYSILLSKSQFSRISVLTDRPATPKAFKIGFINVLRAFFFPLQNKKLYCIIWRRVFIHLKNTLIEKRKCLKTAADHVRLNLSAPKCPVKVLDNVRWHLRNKWMKIRHSVNGECVCVCVVHRWSPSRLRSVWSFITPTRSTSRSAATARWSTARRSPSRAGPPRRRRTTRWAACFNVCPRCCL